MANGAEPLPFPKMVESITRMYGAKQAIVILDYGDSVRSVCTPGLKLNEGLIMTGVAIHHLVEDGSQAGSSVVQG